MSGPASLTPSAPSGAPDLDALGPPPSPPPSQSRRGRWTAVGVVVVVAILVVGGLFWLGVFSPRSGPGASASPAYSSALGPASSAAQGAVGGPWAIVAGAGIALTSAVVEPAANISNQFASIGCSFAWEGTPPSTVTFPASPTNATPGSAGAWVFVSTDPSLTALVTLVTGAGAANLFTFSGTCASGVDLLSSLPGGVVDSTAAAASANAAGGTAFLAAHPGAERSYAIAAPGSLAIWHVTYSTCPLSSGANVTAVQFNVTEYASTGTPITPATVGSVACPSGPIP